MCHRSARVVLAASVMLAAWAGSSTARAQYGSHYGHGHAGLSRYGTISAPGALPPGYQPFAPQVSPSRAQPAQIGSYYPSLSAPPVKPFSNYRPATSVNPRAYQYPRRGFRGYNDYQSWLGR